MPDITILDYIKPAGAITNTCAVITYNGLPALHLNDLISSNPTAEIYVVEDSRDGDDYDKWKSADVAIRNTWKVIKDKVLSTNVIFIERDVLVTTRLPVKEDNTCILPQIGYCNTPYDVSWADEGWWWSEADRLPLNVKEKTLGAVIIALVYCSTNILDKIINPEFDEIFLDDIISEIRLPTLINYVGGNITTWDRENIFNRLFYENIREDTESNILEKIRNKEPGLYHPLKQ